MSVPAFAMIDRGAFMRLRADKQIDLVLTAAEAFPAKIGPGYGLNATMRWAQIQVAKDAYWGAPQPPQKRADKTPTPARISAADANARLRSLPPLDPENLQW